MSVLGNPLLLGPEGYTISRSVRLRSSASAYFSRTPASAGNTTTFTWAGWVKRGSLGGTQFLFYGGNNCQIAFDSDTLYANLRGTGATNYFFTSTAVYRDPSAWYHVVWAVDTTQATSTERVKFYVNGVQVTSFSLANYPPQNTTELSTAQRILGAEIGRYYFDGYMAETYFIDGQALTPSSFGETDAITGVWKAKKYGGTYGTNGFYLPFNDNSSTTNIALDKSGNANNWTANNISLTAGVTYDSMLDVPTLTSATAANYCVMNPLTPSASLSYANLRQNTAAPIIFGTFGQSTGKWYWEVTLTTQSTAALKVGIANANATGELGDTATGWGYIIQSNGNNGQGVHNGSTTSTYSTFTTGDVLNVAVDIDAGKIWWGKNGTYVNSGVPASGTGAVYTDVSGTIYPAASNIDKGGGSGVLDWNFGQRPFTYTPPTGFVALNTFNLPDSTIKQGSKYMNTVLYTGDASTNRSITGVGFQPDFVWTKSRSSASYSHQLADSVRGWSKYLYSNASTAEGTDATNHIQSVNSDGYVINSGASFNASGVTYVSWDWKAGGTAASNTNGSITSQVSANPTGGFSVATFTGNGSAGSTVGHGLGVAPSLIFIKNRSTGTDDFVVYHVSAGAAYRLLLDSSGAKVNDPTGFMNSTAPTSTVFTVGSNSSMNNSGSALVAYSFAPVAGFSTFGSYTGNGSADGPFVYCGFRPRWVMIKRTDAAGNWKVHDTSRDPYNSTGNVLYPNVANAEATADSFYDVLSNGFKLRDTNADHNASGGTFIYAVFAENPFKNSLAR